jgi:hypothetical protein
MRGLTAVNRRSRFGSCRRSDDQDNNVVYETFNTGIGGWTARAIKIILKELGKNPPQQVKRAEFPMQVERSGP